MRRSRKPALNIDTPENLSNTVESEENAPEAEVVPPEVDDVIDNRVPFVGRS